MAFPGKLKYRFAIGDLSSMKTKKKQKQDTIDGLQGDDTIGGRFWTKLAEKEGSVKERTSSSMLTFLDGSEADTMSALPNS